MAGLGIGYSSLGGAAVAISPAIGPVGTVFSVNLPLGATCQWTLNGAAISGATSSTYTSTTTGTLGCTVALAGVAVSAVVTLAALVLSTTSFAPGVSQGSLLATISGQTSGSTVSIASSDTTGYFAVSSSGLVAGLNYGALAAGATPTVQLTETLAGAAKAGINIEAPFGAAQARRRAARRYQGYGSIGNVASIQSLIETDDARLSYSEATRSAGAPRRRSPARSHSESRRANLRAFCRSRRALFYIARQSR
jgi:hypothetical protein